MKPIDWCAAVIDASDGSLIIDACQAIGSDTQRNDIETRMASHNLIDQGDISGFNVYVVDLVLWGRNFGAALRYQNERLCIIDLVWRDGDVNRLGYDASVDILLKEKRQLTKMLASAWAMQPTDATIGVDYFQFSWGVVMVRADQRSTVCGITVHYEPANEVSSGDAR